MFMCDTASPHTRSAERVAYADGEKWYCTEHTLAGRMHGAAASRPYVNGTDEVDTECGEHARVAVRPREHMKYAV